MYEFVYLTEPDGAACYNFLYGFKGAPPARQADRLRPVSWRMRGTYMEA
jgi:hypothetical protein